MKKGLTFFFFLLLFSHCDQVVKTPITIKNGFRKPGEVHMTHLRAGYSSNTTVQQNSYEQSKRRERKRTKNRKASNLNQGLNVPVRSFRNSDSLLISRLKYLRSNRIEPDLNEPLSKSYIFSPLKNQQNPPMIRLSRESFLIVNFDNDLLDYTDRFYTNGIKIEIISSILQMNPLSRMLLPYWGPGTNYYGLSLVQNMYTPSTTKIGGILYGDRPYAAYLFVGSYKITNDSIHNFRQTSELDAGIIGPNSYGEWVQRSFHKSVPTNNEPLGWEYQVQNDLVLNYSVLFEKGIVNRKYFEFLLSSAANFGTLYTNFTYGGQLITGWFNPYFNYLGIENKRVFHKAGLRNIQFFLFIKGAGKLVGYDATLQGGLFNRSSSYTLSSGAISHLTFQGSGGIAFVMNGFRIDIEQFMLSPEFQSGMWHKWVHIALTVGL